MVAKLENNVQFSLEGLNLAKIHMVAKQYSPYLVFPSCLNLAKIHMVAKPKVHGVQSRARLNLAKIHMVAKRVLV